MAFVDTRQSATTYPEIQVRRPFRHLGFLAEEDWVSLLRLVKNVLAIGRRHRNGPQSIFYIQPRFRAHRTSPQFS